MAFAAAGVKGLVLSGRDEADLQQTASLALAKATSSEFETLVVVCDITSESDIINLVQSAVDKFGQIDYAVNNAGVSQRQGSRLQQALLIIML